MTQDITGIIVPMVTPLTTDYDIDVASTKRLIDFLVEGGVHGLFLLGSAGEGPLLPRRLQRKFLETVVAYVKKRVPIVVGISECSTEKCIENTQQLADLGLDALVCTLPYYFQTKGAEQLRHFQTLARTAPVPIMLYDIPMRVKDKLSMNVVAKLAEEANICGLKDSSGDIASLRSIVQSTKRDDFRFLMGETRLIDVAIFLGAHGAVSTVANVDPMVCVDLYRTAKDGDWDLARSKQAELNHQQQEMVLANGGQGHVFQVIKNELVKRRIIATNVVMTPYGKH